MRGRRRRQLCGARARALGPPGYSRRIERKIREILDEYGGDLKKATHLKMFVMVTRGKLVVRRDGDDDGSSSSDDDEVPYVYTKLKSIRLHGNESLLTYLCVRALVLEQRAHAEGGETGDAPHLDLRRAQLMKRSLGLSFVCNGNRVTADYGKREPQPRNAAWEAANGAVRVTTLPTGYEGEAW